MKKSSTEHPLHNTPRSQRLCGENEPEIGIEPTTYSLRENCSTPELLRPGKDSQDKSYLEKKEASKKCITAEALRAQSGKW